MDEQFSNPQPIPEAIPLPRQTSAHITGSVCTTKGGNTYKGFVFGCLFSALFLFAVFAVCFGSCAYLGVRAMASANTFNEKTLGFSENSPSLTQLRPGSGDRKIAVISLQGTITLNSVSNGLFEDDSAASAKRLCRELDAVRDDYEYAAVIIDMNTPGGEVVASDEIRHSVDLLRKAGKPVVTCMHTLGASGGYYIASGSNWIVANRLTMTGSVGVIMQSLEASNLLSKIGVHPLTYRSGNFKDMLSPMRKPTPEEEEYLNAMVKQDFREFCQVISDGRPTYFPTADDVQNAPFADGRVLSGSDALALHLIDELGDFDTAVEKARELADEEDAPVVAYSLRRDWKSWLISMAAPRTPIEVKGLDQLVPGTALQPGMRYYLLPQAAK